MSPVREAIAAMSLHYGTSDWQIIIARILLFGLGFYLLWRANKYQNRG